EEESEDALVLEDRPRVEHRPEDHRGQDEQHAHAGHEQQPLEQPVRVPREPPRGQGALRAAVALPYGHDHLPSVPAPTWTGGAPEPWCPAGRTVTADLVVLLSRVDPLDRLQHAGLE